ncbi:bifunctional epoxide hydrolase 2-like [Dorcoceras hygrometricum]|uniref:Bifunctional epoxide hydrolase 2-like n=1 Tax=Dorcoceras hygrometricum TaxID=472368 RepID=A0A2Z6ZYD6_9LAMI|nr:bifunctional epoxide hydrolase 2-like [Dorcoceras hygrometricum]
MKLDYELGFLLEVLCVEDFYIVEFRSVGIIRREFDEIGQQQVTVARSTRVNDTVARDWSNFEIQSKRWCWLQLEADARIQGSTRKHHVLVTVTHVGTSSKSSL